MAFFSLAFLLQKNSRPFSPSPLPSPSLAPEDFAGCFDLRGAGDDAATLDALTGGAWAGGKDYETLYIPAGAYGVGDDLRDERTRLAYEVRATYPGGSPTTTAAAMDAAAAEAARAAAAAAAAASHEEEEEEGEEAGFGAGGGGGAAYDGPDPHGRVLDVGWMPFDGAAGSV